MATPYNYAGGAFNFNYVLQQWAGVGLFDIILPIVLIFTVVFAILQRAKVLGGNKSIDAVVALVIGFFAISNPYVTQLFIPLFSNAALGIMILLIFLLVMGFVAARVDEPGWSKITLTAGFVIFIWLMSRAADYFGGNYLIFSSDWWYNNAWWLVPLILFGLLIGFVVGPEDNEHEKKKKADLIKSMSFGDYYAAKAAAAA